MVDLEAIRARVKLHTNTELNLPDTNLEILSRWSSWEQDVPALLAIIDALNPLVVAARGFVENDDDTSALERLVEASDHLPWDVLDSLGVGQEDEESDE